MKIYQLSQYSLRHSITNHCDRCITHLGDDMDIISFVMFNMGTGQKPPGQKPPIMK